MSARTFNALTCDKEGCTEQVKARDRETAVELRARAEKEDGWMCRRGFDLCRWHA
jgi:hypothetical protein